MKRSAESNQKSKTESAFRAIGKCVCGTFLVALVLVAATPAARAADYSLEIVVQQGDTIDGKTFSSVGVAVINDPGQVAFLGRFTGGRGIFTPTEALVLEGDIISGKTLTQIFTVNGINNDGDVVFWASTLDGGQGIFTQHEAIVVTGDTIEGRTMTGLGGLPAINNAGQVVFQGIFDGGTGVFTREEALAVSGDVIDGKVLGNFVGNGFINNSVDVVFAARFNDNGGARTGIFTLDELIVAEGDFIEGNEVNFVTSRPAINDPGDIMHNASFDDGERILLGSTVFLEPGDTIDGFTIDNPSIGFVNNNMTIAGASSVNGGSGSSVFTQDDIVAVTGDAVDSKTIRINSPLGINNSGRIVIFARLNPGNITGIVLATPKAIGKRLAVAV